MLLALWTMLCFLFWTGNKKYLFILCATAMLLTKESGGVFFIALFLYESGVFVIQKDKKFSVLFRNLSLVIIPIAIASTNYIIQKIKFGWFLYPFYMDVVKSSRASFFENLPSAAAYTFIYDGRNGISIFIVISLLLIFFFFKKKFSKMEQKTIIVFTLFIFLFLLFSSVNYYIPRYLMCIFPPFIIIASFIIEKAFVVIKPVLALIITGMVVTGIFFYAQPKQFGDRDYSPSVITCKNTIDYCESQRLYTSYIFTGSIMRAALSEPYAGFISGVKFTHVQWEFDDKTEYCIFNEDEYDKALADKIKKEYKLRLVSRVALNYAWSEIYIVER